MNVPIDISNVVLHTERLLLRPWRLEDLNDFFEYASVDGVGQMAGWSPHKDKEESLSVLQRFIENKKTFALLYDGKAIGSLGIEKYKEEEFAELQEKRGRELGFVLSKAHWGCGLTAEAVNAVVRYLFEEQRLDFLLCGHFLDNEQSKRVQEKCGFRIYKQIPYKTQCGIVKDCCMRILENQTQR